MTGFEVADFEVVNALFVVGSLSEGMVHFHRVQNQVSQIEPGVSQGQLFVLQVGFPVFSTQGSNQISGQILHFKTESHIWPLLDQLHGVHLADPNKGLHIRKSIEVKCYDRTSTVYVYDVNLSKVPKTATLLSGEDWKKKITEEPPLTERLTDQQKTYIKKLGQSSGREIVPINLSLYRELMKLELIVDKGRRLALSHLGKEAFRYLE